MSDDQPPAAGSAPSGEHGSGADADAPNYTSRRALRDAERGGARRKGDGGGKAGAPAKRGAAARGGVTASGSAPASGDVTRSAKATPDSNGRRPDGPRPPVPPLPIDAQGVTGLPAEAMAPVRRRDLRARNAVAGWTRPPAVPPAAVEPSPVGSPGEPAAVEPAPVGSPGEPAAVEPAPVPAAQIVPQPATPKASTAKPRTSKAGRNLPAAIVVGLGLLLLVLGGLLLYPVALTVIVAGFAAVGVWEVSRALLQRRIAVPLAPVLVGTVAMPPAAYFAGAEGLLFALVASAVAVLVWRCLDPDEGAVPSIFAGVFVLAWIPFMMSFVFLLLRAGGPTTGITWLSAPHVGALQVAIMLLLVVANDTFGYLVGATFGKHPMAPKISPKKSWEGFAGSVAGAVLVGVLATVFLLGQPWWLGLVLAVGLVPAGTAGDLAESMVKRELGVKDMSSILPGHGGVMDRLDSILFSAPMAFLIFTALAQVQA